MKDLLEQFNKTMAYLTKARDAYLSKKIHVSCYIMEKCRLKLVELTDKLESETLRRKYDDWENKLTTVDIQALQNFNDQLAILEKKIIKEVKALKESGRCRLDSTDEDFVTCFRVKIEIDYFIGEDDPAYNDERDNCIATSKRVGDDIMAYDDQDWNTMRNGGHHRR